MTRPLSAFERLRQAAEEKEQQRQAATQIASNTELAGNLPLASSTPIASNETVASKRPVASDSRLGGNEAITVNMRVADLPATTPDLPANLPASEATLAGKAASVVLPASTGVAGNSKLPATKRKAEYPSLLVPKVTVRIPEDLQQDLRLLMLERNESFQGIILLAIRHLLASEQLRQTTNYQPPDLMIDDVAFKTTSSIISVQQALDYYAKHTGNEIKDRDRQIARTLTGFNGPAIKCGILLSVIRAKTKIHSLKYCVGAIHEAAETNVTESYVTWLEMRKEKAMTR